MEPDPVELENVKLRANELADRIGKMLEGEETHVAIAALFGVLTGACDAAKDDESEAKVKFCIRQGIKLLGENVGRRIGRIIIC